MNAFAMNAVMLEAIAELARRGIEPPVWRSSNSPGGDEANVAVMARYKPRVKGLCQTRELADHVIREPSDWVVGPVGRRP